MSGYTKNFLGSPGLALVIVSAEGRTWEWPDADVECRPWCLAKYVSLRMAYSFLKGYPLRFKLAGNMALSRGRGPEVRICDAAEPDSRVLPLLAL